MKGIFLLLFCTCIVCIVNKKTLSRGKSCRALHLNGVGRSWGAAARQLALSFATHPVWQPGLSATAKTTQAHFATPGTALARRCSRRFCPGRTALQTSPRQSRNTSLRADGHAGSRRSAPDTTPCWSLRSRHAGVRCPRRATARERAVRGLREQLQTLRPHAATWWRGGERGLCAGIACDEMRSTCNPWW